MSHADTLRGMAKDHLIAGNEHTADALLAGADALDTRAHAVIAQAETIQTLSRLLAGAEEAATERATQIERVRAVVDQLDKRSDAAYLSYKTNPENTRLDGQAMAYEQAVVLIQRALGGTP